MKLASVNTALCSFKQDYGQFLHDVGMFPEQHTGRRIWRVMWLVLLLEPSFSVILDHHLQPQRVAATR